MHLRFTRARGRLLPLFAALVVGCSADQVVAGENVVGDDTELLADLEPHDAGSLRLLDVTTPEGTGQIVHPDFAQMSGWRTPFLIVATPYPNSDATHENPVLYAREQGFTWSPFDGFTAPIARPRQGFLSDPDMVAIPKRGELWVYYREVQSRNVIYLIRTRDGVTFDTPREVVSAENHNVISPAVVRRDSTRWRMWSVNAGPQGCNSPSTTVELRRSIDGVRWSRPKAVNLVQPGLFVWHIDVQWIPSRQEYWALYAVKKSATCATHALYLATSPDGVNWTTNPAPVLAAGVIPEFADVVYRSTFAYDPATDAIRFWFSGARHEARLQQWIWRTAYDRRDRAEVFATIARPVAPRDRRIALRPAPPFDPP